MSQPMVILGAMYATADRQLDHLLPRQLGVLSRAQAFELGFTDRMIHTRVTHGHWRKLAPAVYALGAYPSTWEQRCMAAVLAEPDAALGGKTAAVIHRLPGFRSGPIELTVEVERSHPTQLARVRRSSRFEPVVVNGFRVQSVELTLVELAGRVSYQRLDRAFEDAVLRDLLTMEAFVEWYLRLARSRRPGLRSIRAIIDSRGDGFVPAESELEAMLFAALDAPGIPPITRQAPFPWSPDDPQRVDGFIEAWGILLEADGRRWHARLETMEADRHRDHEAVRRGFQPLRFGWIDLRDDPAKVRSIVIETGRHRARTRRAA